MLEPMLAGARRAAAVDRRRRARRQGGGAPFGQGHPRAADVAGKGPQFVPGQAAVAKLTITVPQVPASTQAWEVLPGEVRGLKIERVVGGTKITLPEFGLTTAIVFTSDTNLVVRFQEAARSTGSRPPSGPTTWPRYSLEKVLKIEEDWRRRGTPRRTARTSPRRPDAARRRRGAVGHASSTPRRTASRSGRCGRRASSCGSSGTRRSRTSTRRSPARTRCRSTRCRSTGSSWTRSSTATPAPNVLPGGDFETVPGDPPDAWQIDEPTLDDVEMLAIRVERGEGAVEVEAGGVPSTIDKPKEGKQCALLQIRPKNGRRPPLALERTLVSR